MVNVKSMFGMRELNNLMTKIIPCHHLIQHPQMPKKHQQTILPATSKITSTSIIIIKNH